MGSLTIRQLCAYSQQLLQPYSISLSEVPLAAVYDSGHCRGFNTQFLLDVAVRRVLIDHPDRVDDIRGTTLSVRHPVFAGVIEPKTKAWSDIVRSVLDTLLGWVVFPSSKQGRVLWVFSQIRLYQVVS